MKMSAMASAQRATPRNTPPGMKQTQAAPGVVELSRQLPAAVTQKRDGFAPARDGTGAGRLLRLQNSATCSSS